MWVFSHELLRVNLLRSEFFQVNFFEWINFEMKFASSILTKLDHLKPETWNAKHSRTQIKKIEKIVSKPETRNSKPKTSKKRRKKLKIFSAQKPKSNKLWKKTIWVPKCWSEWYIPPMKFRRVDRCLYNNSQNGCSSSGMLKRYYS